MPLAILALSLAASANFTQVSTELVRAFCAKDHSSSNRLNDDLIASCRRYNEGGQKPFPSFTQTVCLGRQAQTWSPDCLLESTNHTWHPYTEEICTGIRALSESRYPEVAGYNCLSALKKIKAEDRIHKKLLKKCGELSKDQLISLIPRSNKYHHGKFSLCLANIRNIYLKIDNLETCASKETFTDYMDCVVNNRITLASTAPKIVSRAVPLNDCQAEIQKFELFIGGNYRDEEKINILKNFSPLSTSCAKATEKYIPSQISIIPVKANQ